MIIRPEEWISKPDSDGNGLLQAWMVDGETEFPIPIETHNVSLEDVKLNENQDFDFILECAEKPEVYDNETTYSNDARHAMAPESVIPAGLFSVSEDDDFVPSPRIILNGKVVAIHENPAQLGFENSDVLFLISCLGNEYPAVLHGPSSNGIKIKEGNVISCVYWVQGWPRED